MVVMEMLPFSFFEKGSMELFFKCWYYQRTDAEKAYGKSCKGGIGKDC